ncbi:hypothetical protein E0Z10_g3852 [Xylaria hypoxylon]|uniref:Histidine phosphatase superfamily n=1 Tax=Xylaria hypoxylon TaxID=37992 RepID=A0A4Z0Z2G3_9PEZI|nr:hypothetical protein E0Z10_g3852 [Xylaria hypoxylon]
MPVTFHFIRHAESTHNVSMDLNEHDPVLTQTGHKQCRELAAEIRGLGHEFDLVLCSPMKRTIQTALAIFPKYLRSDKIMLHSDFQEGGTYGADTGSPPEELKTLFGTKKLDYWFVAPDWTDKRLGTRYHVSVASKRGQAARLFLKLVARMYRDTDAHIAVVSHGFFLANLIFPKSGSFGNADRRTYYIDYEEDHGLLTFITETPCSIAKREKKRLDAIPKGDFQNSFGFQLPAPGGLQYKAPDLGGTVCEGMDYQQQTSYGGQQPSSGLFWNGQQQNLSGNCASLFGGVPSTP